MNCCLLLPKVCDVCSVVCVCVCVRVCVSECLCVSPGLLESEAGEETLDCWLSATPAAENMSNTARERDGVVRDGSI